MAFYKYGIASAPGSFNDFNKSASDICSFSFIYTESSYFCVGFSFGDSSSLAFVSGLISGYFCFSVFRSESSSTFLSFTNDLSSSSFGDTGTLGLD
jgi:hypothetical protein